MRERQRQWPTALSATSTHDSKRGEDVRARLNVLSEIPGAWKTAVAKWRAVNRKFKTEVNGRPAPDANEEYLIYQTLVGAWPFDLRRDQEPAFAERIANSLVKALREAKVHSSWPSPDEEYEGAVLKFAASVLHPHRGAAFREAFLPFHARVANLGVYNSLAQLALKITAPGIPDFYRGTEFWDLSLVDPDNRRPVDFAERERTLSRMHDCGSRVAVDPDELLAARSDGRVKMYAMARALAARARFRELFEHGDYVPLETSGLHKDCAFAFARRLNDTSVVTCVPRLVTALVPDAAPPLGPVWADTQVELPIGGSLCNVFTGATVTPEPAGDVWTIPASTLFERFPIAILVPSRP
jgi:(1->4)-alpha-D-glucan 1-alpha-D-glucosylmutase